MQNSFLSLKHSIWKTNSVLWPNSPFKKKKTTFFANQIIIQIQCITHKPQSTVYLYSLWRPKINDTGLITQNESVYVSYHCSRVYAHIDEEVSEVSSCECFWSSHASWAFTGRSVAFHSRLWPSSWREPARGARPGPEALRTGQRFSCFPSLAWTCWRAPGSSTLFRNSSY